MAVLKYSLLRLGVFVVVFVVCLNVDLGRFTLVFALIVGLIVSWAVAYLFFNRWRLAAVEQLSSRSKKPQRRSAAERQDNAAEDDLADQFHQEEDPQQT